MKPQGIIPALLTPFDGDESINEAEYRAHAERMLAANVDGIFAGGTNGEFFALSFDEKLRIAELAIETANGTVPVYAGTGAITTAETIALSKAAEGIGVDALSVIAPYFAAASQDELYDHYKKVAESVQLPILIYNIPARTGNGILPSTVARLAEVENIVGVKDSSGNFDLILQFIEGTRGKDFSVLAGNDSLILWTLMAGGAGAITGICNIYPETLVGIYQAWLAGDFEHARELQDSIRPIRRCLAEGNPNTIVKRAVEMCGYPVGSCRAPFNQVSANAVAMLESVLQQ